MQNFLTSHGILFQVSSAYRHSENGKIDQMIGTLRDCARTLLVATPVPRNLWRLALEYASTVWNVLVRPRATNSPYFMVYGHDADLSRFKVFGAQGYAWKTPDKLGIDSCALRGFFVGFSKRSKEDLLCVPELHKIVKVREARYDEAGAVDRFLQQSSVGLPLGRSTEADSVFGLSTKRVAQ